MPVRRGLRVVATALAAVGVAGVVAAPASAGTYRVIMCEAPDGSAVPTDGITLMYSGYVWLGDECTTGNKRIGLRMQGNPLPAGAASMPDLIGGTKYYTHKGAQGAVQLLAAPNTQFVAANVVRSVSIGAPSPRDVYGSPNTAMFAGTIAENDANLAAGSWCIYFRGCASETRRVVSWSGRTGALYWHLGCGGPFTENTTTYCATAPNGGARAEVSLHRIDVTVEDASSPRVDGVPATGSILGSGDLQGTQSLRANVIDSGAGVAQAYVRLTNTSDTSNTKIVSSWTSGHPGCSDAGQAPGPDYRRLAPCRPDADLNFAVDTTSVADGTYRFELHAVDAAGNDGLIAADQIRINNLPAPTLLTPPTIQGVPAGGLRPGDRLTATPGVWTQSDVVKVQAWQWQRASDGGWTNIPGANGQTYVPTKDDLDRALRVVVFVTNGQEQVQAESVQTPPVRSGATILGQSVGTGDGSAQLVSDRELRSIQVSYGARVVITGRLLDRDGQPIGGADVEVLEQLAIAGAPWTRVGMVKTDAQGGYAYRPSTSGSRTLRFAYSRRDGSTGFRATRDVAISVAAKMTARAVRSRVPIGGVIRLRGRVTVSPLPRTGTWVEVQVSDAGVWRTIATVRAGSRGGWSFKHRLRGRERASFSFRARLRPVADVPSSESVSKPTRVRVR